MHDQIQEDVVNLCSSFQRNTILLAQGQSKGIDCGLIRLGLSFLIPAIIAVIVATRNRRIVTTLQPLHYGSAMLLMPRVKSTEHNTEVLIFHYSLHILEYVYCCNHCLEFIGRCASVTGHRLPNNFGLLLVREIMHALEHANTAEKTGKAETAQESEATRISSTTTSIALTLIGIISRWKSQKCDEKNEVQNDDENVDLVEGIAEKRLQLLVHVPVAVHTHRQLDNEDGENGNACCKHSCPHFV